MKAKHVCRAIRLAVKTKRPLFIWGSPGIGKSDLVKQVGREDDLQLIDLRLAYRDLVDLMGLPMMDKNGVRWVPPSFFPRDGTGILFLDELPAASPAVQCGAYQLTHDRGIGEYRLPPGWTVIAAGNRQSDRAVSHRMPSALASRFQHVSLFPDLEDWSDWAAGADLVPEIIAFNRTLPKFHHDFDPATWKDGTPFACPRTWHYLDQLIKEEPEIFGLGKSKENKGSVEKATADPSWQLELVQGTVGEAAGLQFFLWLRCYLEIPSIDEILKHPDAATIPDKPGGKYAVTSGLAHRAKPENLDKVLTYLDRMPREFSFFCMKDAMRRNPTIADAQAFGPWAIRNKDILATIQRS